MRLARRQYITAIPETVTAAQSITSLNASSMLAARRHGGPLYVYPELACPPGERQTLVDECATWLPEYECTILSSGHYDCYVKKWHCTDKRQVWRCVPIELTVFEG